MSLRTVSPFLKQDLAHAHLLVCQLASPLCSVFISLPVASSTVQACFLHVFLKGKFLISTLILGVRNRSSVGQTRGVNLQPVPEVGGQLLLQLAVSGIAQHPYAYASKQLSCTFCYLIGHKER